LFNEVYNTSAEFKEYVTENYVKTGKMLSVKREWSEDNNQFILTVDWASHEAFLEFVSDEVCVQNSIGPNHMYDTSNEIESQTTTEES
jgi:hypothetical protein